MTMNRDSTANDSTGDNAPAEDPPPVAPPAPPNAPLGPNRNRLNRNRHGGGRGRGGGGRGNGSGNRNLGNNSGVDRGIETINAPLKAPMFALPSENKSLRTFDKTVAVLRTYVLEKFEYGDDLFPIIDDLKDMDMKSVEPKEPEASAGKIALLEFDYEVEYFFYRKKAYEKNTALGYDIVWNQCTKGLQQKLLGVKGYGEAKLKKNMLWLLKSIKDTVYQFDSVKPTELSVDDALERIIKYRQGNLDLAEYHKTFVNYLKVYEQNAGHFGVTYKDVLDIQGELDKKGLSAEDYKVEFSEAVQDLRDRAVAIAFLKRADKNRYSELQNNLQNSFLNGTDEYPGNIAEALHKLTYFQPTLPVTQRQPRPTSDRNQTGLSFFLTSSPHSVVAGTDGEVVEGIICFRCGCPGHKSIVCPKTDADAAASLATARAQQSVSPTPGFDFASFSFHSNIVSENTFMHDLRTNYILLDSQGSDHLFCNEQLLEDVKCVSTGLETQSNGGSLCYNRQGVFRGLDRVWLNDNGIANIISLGRLSDMGVRVTLDTWNGANGFLVHLKDYCLRFHKLKQNLFICDLRTCPSFTFKNFPTEQPRLDTESEASSEESTPMEDSNISLLNTVQDRKAQFTRREVKGADMAVQLRRHLGSISKSSLQNAVTQLQNCPITPADVKRAVYIHGDCPSSAKGRSTWKKAKPVPILNPISIPEELFQNIKNVTLCLDFFYINGIPIFHAISKNIKFRSVSFPTNRTHATILQEYESVKRIYESIGFTVTQVCADNEFDCIKMDIMPVHLETVGANEHVPEVERSIRHIKECTRGCLHDLPYTKITREMTIGVVKTMVKYCNAFYGEDGVGDKLSPRNIVLGLPNLTFESVCKMRTCMPALVTIRRKKTNTMSTRAVEAIALSPQNDHGAWYFQSLTTGKKIRSHIYDPMPISDRILNRVTELATKDDMPCIQDGRMIFEWTPGDPIDDDDLEVLQMNMQERDENPGAESGAQQMHNLGNNHFAILTDDESDSDDDSDYEDDQDGEINDTPATVTQNEVNDEEADDEEDENIDDIIQEFTDADAVNTANTTNDSDDNEEIIVEDVDDDDEEEVEDEGASDAETGRGHRQRKPNSRYYNESFSFLQTPFEDLEMDDRKEFFKHATDNYMQNGDTRLLQRFITGFVFTQMQTTEQMSAKKGIEIFGDEAVDALFKELAQLVDMTVFKPRKAEELTRKQRRMALRAINLIKRKRCGKLKGRTVANGKQQRGRYDKTQTASPTVSLEALLMTCMIDAMEGREVAVADVVGAYLKARMEDFVLMKFTGETVDILCDIDPSYKEYVTYENGQKVLYVELLKALYGCVQSALLWYELFTGSLMDMGFELNPFDMCIANSIIDGSQCTICIYVDDNKISHKNIDVVKDIITKIESKFGKMEVTYGDNHTFLGMKIRYNRKRKTVTVDMKEYILESIDESGMDITRNANTPAKPNLYTVDINSPALNEDKKERFHSVVAKLCYIAERSRLDIKPAMSFLRTRVQKPTVQDWGKLKRVLCYLRGTIDLHLTLGADTLTKLQTWVDASYAIHDDRKSHTGGAMSFGRGVICSKSNKQKLNTKSSTEAEVVGASDYLPNTIWLRMFLEAQGYVIEESMYYQDNESAMKIELNGWRSTGSKSKHVDIRFYFIADRIKNERIQIIHCKTEHMVADFFTKPLQGALFKRLRDIVMGVVPIDDVFDFVKQERVVENKSLANDGKVNSQDNKDALNEPPRNQRFQQPQSTRTYADVVKEA